MSVRVLAVLTACAALSWGQSGAPNLVANGDFSQIAEGIPAQWIASGDPQRVDQRLQAVTDGGRPCARLTCTRIEGEGGYTHAMVAQVGTVRLESGRLYEFSCRARQQGIRGAGVNVAISDTSVWANCGLERGLGLGSEWRTFRFVFRATRTVGPTSRLQFWFTETGTLWLSDVRIVPYQAGRVEFTHVAAQMPGPNLVPNGSFALGDAGWRSYGIQTGWGNMAHLHGVVIRSHEPGHAHFLRMPFGEGRTPTLGFDYFKPALQAQTRLMAANVGWIPVDKDAAYTVSCDMRASVDDVPGLLAYASLDPDASRWGLRQGSRSVTLGRQWRRFTFTFSPPMRYVFVAAGVDLRRDTRVDVDLDNVVFAKGAPDSGAAPPSLIEVAVTPASPSGWFNGAGRPELTVSASGHASARSRVVVRVSATDYVGSRAALPAVVLTLPSSPTPAHASYAARRVPIPPSWRGWYGLKVSAASEPGPSPVSVVTPEVRIAILPGTPPTDSAFGLNHAFPDPYLMRVAKGAGIAWYRDWSLKWEHVEPQRGVFRWEAPDEQVSRVVGAGAHLMALLPPFPSAEWSSTAPEALRTSGYPGERIRQAWAPSDSAPMGDFIARSVARYRDRIRIWEFLNEPLYTDYALPGRHYTPSDYVRLLRVAAAAMRRSDPKCRVMGGVGAGPGRFTTELMDAGLLDTVDILNLHMYPGSRAPEGFIAEMDRLNAEMRRRGKPKPIWITEFSYYGADDLPRKPFLPTDGDWAEARLLNSERECADYTVRFAAIMLARGVEKVFIHSGSSDTVNLPSFECCLMAQGGAPRKAGVALGVMARLLGASPKPMPMRKLPEEVYGARFACGRTYVEMLWSPGRSVRHRLPNGCRAMDIMGRAVMGPTILLGDAPVYLVAPLPASAPRRTALPRQRRSMVADLDRDGATETVLLDPGRHYAVRVLRRGRVIAQDVPSRWRPWKLELADVDGDGRTEIVVGVHKATRYIPRPHNCLFVYRLREGRLHPVWLGSSLSRPFTDFTFAPPGSGRRWQLYAIEKTTVGRCGMALYRWNGFGFTLDRRTGNWATASFVGASPSAVTIRADGAALTEPRAPTAPASRGGAG